MKFLVAVALLVASTQAFLPLAPIRPSTSVVVAPPQAQAQLRSRLSPLAAEGPGKKPEGVSVIERDITIHDEVLVIHGTTFLLQILSTKPKSMEKVK